MGKVVVIVEVLVKEIFVILVKELVVIVIDSIVELIVIIVIIVIGSVDLWKFVINDLKKFGEVNF